ncbi:F-box/FBD/LRR-repeat protein At1g13570 [Linum perenne]
MAGSSADRISSLPNNVRERILMFLPLKEAAKSSILSTKWRNLWTNLPSIVINESFSNMGLEPMEVVDKLMLNVYRVLLLHGGNLKGFSLSHSMLRYQTYHLLRLLPYRNLESLTVDTGGFYKLPIRVCLAFYKLKTLRLSECKFTFSPVSFHGFRRLTDFELKRVRFKKNLAQLRFSCPLLVTVIIESYSRYQRPVILIQEAPNLSCFRFDGWFASLRLGYTPRLKDVMIENWNHVLGKKFGPNLLEIDGGFAAVESLCVSSNFYEYLATGDTPFLQDLGEPWKKLRHLRLDDVDLSISSHLWSVVCMTICSPNLQQLSICMRMKMNKFTGDDKEGLDGDDEALRMMKSGVAVCNYEESRVLLTRMELKMVRGTRNEMTLIRWLLNTSPILEEMNIQFDYVLAGVWKLLAVAELNEFRRASSRAQIIFQNVTSSKALN